MVLGSLAVLLGTLGDMQGSTALVGWSAVVLAILVALAVAASRNGRPVVAGLCGFVAVAVVAVVAGSLLDAVGLAGRRVAVRPGLRAGAVARRDRRPRRRALRGPQAALPAAAARGDGRQGRARARHRRGGLRHGQLARLGGAPARAGGARDDRHAPGRPQSVGVLEARGRCDPDRRGRRPAPRRERRRLGADRRRLARLPRRGALDRPLRLGRRRRRRALRSSPRTSSTRETRSSGWCRCSRSRRTTAGSSSGRRRSSTPASASSTSCSGGCSRQPTLHGREPG